MTIQELEQFIATYGTDIDRKQTGGGRIVSGHLPENPGTVGQDTKRRKSEKLFTICCNSDLEKSEPENMKLSTAQKASI